MRNDPKIYFLCGFVLLTSLGFPNSGFAQEDQVGIIKLYPLGPLFAADLQIGYERPLTEKLSGEFTIGYHWRNYFVSEQVSIDVIDRLNNACENGKGFSLEAGVNYHLPFSKEELPFGFYVGPQLIFKYTKYKELFVEFDPGCQFCSNKTIDAKQIMIGLQFIAGYQTKLFNEFTLGTYSGLGIRYKSITEDTIIGPLFQAVEGSDSFQAEQPKYGRLTPSFHLGLTIGYRII